MAGSASIFVPEWIRAPSISNKKAERIMSSLNTFYKLKQDGDLPALCRVVVESQIGEKSKKTLKGEGMQTLSAVALENAKKLALTAHNTKELIARMNAAPDQGTKKQMHSAVSEMKSSFKRMLAQALDVKKISWQIGARMLSWIEKGQAAAEGPKPA